MASIAELEKRVRDFGYGRPDCQIINYWTGDDRLSGQPVITCSNPQVKWIGMWKPKEQVLLLVMINWADGSQKTVLSVKDPNLTVWQDAESGEPVSKGKMKFKGREVKILKISK